jgi:maleate isomerase
MLHSISDAKIEGRRRLGMMVPSSNTVAEPETLALLPDDDSVTLHVSRVRVVEVSQADSSTRQFAPDTMLAAAEQLADAEVDLILWNGTAASWLGFEHDQRIVENIASHTGIAATTATIAVNDELTRLTVKRIGLVTPYVAALETKIIANYRSIGIEVAAAARRDLTHNTDYAALSSTDIAAMIHDVAKSRPDAIVVLCTNLAGARIATAMTQEVGIPVVDSVRAAVEHSLMRIERAR